MNAIEMRHARTALLLCMPFAAAFIGCGLPRQASRTPPRGAPPPHMAFHTTTTCGDPRSGPLTIDECRNCADGVAEQFLAHENRRSAALRAGSEYQLSQYDVELLRLADRDDGRAIAEFRYHNRESVDGRHPNEFSVLIDRRTGKITVQNGP